MDELTSPPGSARPDIDATRASSQPATSALVAGMGVDVYRNLNRPGVVWSVRCRRSGRVVAHALELRLAEVTFVVQPAGAARARREHIRNVHAFARGVIAAQDTPSASARGAEGARVSYDPFGSGGFYTAAGPILSAPFANFDARGAHVPAPPRPDICSTCLTELTEPECH